MHISNNMNVNQNLLDEETEELDNNIKDISEESDIKESLEEFLDNPYDVIKATAEALSINIKPPNRSCKKCYGRGWIGRRSDTKEPIPCKCIFDKEVFDREMGNPILRKFNRAERRRLGKK